MPYPLVIKLIEDGHLSHRSVDTENRGRYRRSVEETLALPNFWSLPNFWTLVVNRWRLMGLTILIAVTFGGIWVISQVPLGNS